MRPLPALVLGLLILLPARAQFWAELANPKVEARFMHPPELGIRVSRLALQPTPYPESRELADDLAGALRREGQVEVVDSARLEPGDPGGATLLVDVHRARVSRTNTTKESKDSKGTVTVTRTATTTLEFSATLQILGGDGKLLQSLKFEESPHLSKESTSGVPAHPGETELRRGVHGRVKDRIFRLLFPWPEILRITFFDDDAYGMDKAHARLRDRDPKGALEWARRGDAEATADRGGKAKYRERAKYNLGAAHMVLGDFEAAIPRLQEARDMNPEASIFRETLQECLRARDTQAAYLRWQSKAAANPPKKTGAEARKPSVEQRLEELDRLRKKGLITEQDFQRRKEELLREI
ncbi:MAG: hypothetical protein HY823_07955 [Acidobacteria bacterium]|nr:hypothetical protein [Acidobacteriota bacterium]